MILLDTSVWVDHLHRGDSLVVQVLEAGQAAVHAFVIGELACGNLKSRVRVIDLLQALPRLAMAMDDEVLYFIERHKLMGRGIGYVDAHLLAASSISGSLLWTRDKRLREVSTELGVAYPASTFSISTRDAPSMSSTPKRIVLPCPGPIG